mgnify:FL=1|jgi:hypothetical protein|tara:strand:+ start:406 stop:1035 length:630 start_codon:yes stop_codon:yes gene_type:complete
MAGIVDLLIAQDSLIKPPNAYQPPKPPPTIQDILEAQENDTYTPEMYEEYLANLSPKDKARRLYRYSGYSEVGAEDHIPFSDFLTELKNINRKKLSPDYIYETSLFGKPKYNKTASSLFTDSYDADSDKNLGVKGLEREYSSFRDIMEKSHSGKLNFSDDLIFNSVLSPVGINLLGKIQNYNQKYKLNSKYLPETYHQLLAMKPPKGKA